MGLSRFATQTQVGTGIEAYRMPKYQLDLSPLGEKKLRAKVLFALERVEFPKTTTLLLLSIGY